MRAVQNNTLTKVSPTQVKEFSRCQRKWWYNKVARIKTEQTFEQAGGENIHAEMQAYYEEGTVPTHPSAKLMVESGDLPARAPGILVEQPRDFNLGIRASGIPMIGKVDLTVPEADQVLIIDWKSTANLKYAAKKDVLATDIQLSTYGFAALCKWPRVSSVQFWHGYLATKDPDRKEGEEPDPNWPGKYKIVKTDPLTREHVAGVYGGIEDTVADMKAIAHTTVAEEVPGNADACNDFQRRDGTGGCPYRHLCAIGSSVFRSDAKLTPVQAVDFRAKLLARRQAFDKKNSSAV